MGSLQGKMWIHSQRWSKSNCYRFHSS